MERINLPFYYQLGTMLNSLTKYEYEVKNRVEFIGLCYRVDPYIRAVINMQQLAVSRKLGIELVTAIVDVQKWISENPPEKWDKADYTLDIKIRDIISKSKEYETVLVNELYTLDAYNPPQKGIYSTTYLIEQAERLFPQSILDKIDDKVINEVRESGRCLAFDIWTASAFHILRAMELVLHNYYLCVCKPSPLPKKRLENWGAYIKELQKSTDPSVSEVIAILQQIKDKHRNLIMHPDAVLSADESFTLFEIAQGAIIAMVSALPVPKKRIKKA